MKKTALPIIWPESGTYIVAVSGGVDSVVLLDLLASHDGYELTVAHVDHGIRPDSHEDAKLVERLAGSYQLPFISTELHLGKEASEEEARTKRYEFLLKQGSPVITAHHADDVLETSIMNIRRGTDRYGAAGGMSRQGIIRPLITISKQELIKHARHHNLEWREDSTNKDTEYTRNSIRHELIPTIDQPVYRRRMEEVARLNKKIDSKLKSLVSTSKNKLTLRRNDLSTLSLREVEVLLAYAFRQVDPTLELSQSKIAELARKILLDPSKNSFSLAGSTSIMVNIL